MKNIKLPKRVKIDFTKLNVKCYKTPCGWYIYPAGVELNDLITEYLSNEYSYCVNSMSYKTVFKKGVPTSVDVTNIDWDTTQ